MDAIVAATAGLADERIRREWDETRNEAFKPPPKLVQAGMHMRATSVLLTLAVALVSSGCVSNMPELKEALGVVEPPPVVLPPEAAAHANITSTLTGAPVRFSAEGSRDPQGLPLTFAWHIGESITTEGATVAHAFDAPGEWRVVLNVTNEAGLSSEASVLVQVAQANRAPIASLVVRDEAGQALANAARMGERLAFDATGSGDPDEGPDALTFEWDFGDGATSHDAAARHAYDAPGLYVVKLRVADREGASAMASKLVAVDGAYAFDGAFDATSGNTRTHRALVPDGARELRVTLTYPAALGGNDLELRVADASGASVGATDKEPRAGQQGSATREMTLAGEALRAFEDGEWAFTVVREKGVNPAYSVEVAVAF